VLKLTGVEDGPTFTNDKTGDPEPTIRLLLEVDRGPSKGMRVSALMNPASWGPKSNARRWAEALSGGDVVDDSIFDPEEHLDTLVWARVVVKPDSKNVERNYVETPVNYAALEAQFAGGSSGARPRPAAPPSPTGAPRLAPGLEASPDKERELPDEAWSGVEAPPVEEAQF